MNLNFCHSSVPGSIAENVSTRVPAISSSPMSFSHGAGSLAGKFIGSLSPSITSPAIGPVGDA